MKKIFYRVYSRDSFAQFGYYERNTGKAWKVGDTIQGLYATPHLECAANMVAWNNDKAWEVEGGISNSYILVIEADDYFNPCPASCYNERTDRDEVVIRKGKVKAIYTPKDFASHFNVAIKGFYDFLDIYP